MSELDGSCVGSQHAVAAADSLASHFVLKSEPIGDKQYTPDMLKMTLKRMEIDYITIYSTSDISVGIGYRQLSVVKIFA
jgi:hypothetical protein